MLNQCFLSWSCSRPVRSGSQAALSALALCTVLLGSLPSAATAVGLLDRLTGGGDSEILDPEQAFRFSHSIEADGLLHLQWTIEPGYYLYRDKFAATSLDENTQIGPLERPPGLIKDDPEFGRVEIYKEAAAMTASLTAAKAAPETVGVEVVYQGCKEDSICYPPIKKRIEVSTAALETDFASPAVQNFDSGVLSADAIAETLRGRTSLWVIAGTFFVFGLLLSLTPCVFPMIPILSGIIVGQGPSMSVARGVGLSAIYIVAVASTYAVVGLAAGLFGHNLQATFQHPAVIVAFSAVFVALAFSMFGYYELQLPSAVQTRLDKLSRTQRGGNAIGVAVMGVLSAIIVGPCVAPPLAGALIYLGHQGSAVIGGTALFAMGLGMGMPLLLVGASAGKLLPRAGVWMDAVKRVFGVMLIAVAIWFLERVLPGPAVLFLWAILFIVCAIFLGALDTPVAQTSGMQRFGKGLGLVSLCYGAVLVVGAGAGATDPLRPLQPLTARSPAQSQPALSFVAIKSVADLDSALSKAAAAGKYSMLDFYADWCIECKHLERETFQHHDVRSALQSMQLIRADVTANDEIDQALLQRFELFGPPALLFFDPSGVEARRARVIGFVDGPTFTQHLSNLKNE